MLKDERVGRENYLKRIKTNSEIFEEEVFLAEQKLTKIATTIELGHAIKQL